MEKILLRNRKNEGVINEEDTHQYCLKEVYIPNIKPDGFYMIALGDGGHSLNI